MRRNISNSVLCVLVLMGFTACKTRKVAVQAPVVIAAPVEHKDEKKQLLLSQLNDKQVVYNTLSIRAKAALNLDGNSHNVVMNIRMKKDETIWVSVTSVIEVARVLITPDSIKIINRLENTYTKKPFNLINTFTNEQITFKTLQSILVGNCMDEFLNIKSDLRTENGTTVVSGLSKDLNYRFTFNSLLKLSQLDLKDVDASQTLTVGYGDHAEFGGKIYPRSVNINSQAGKNKLAADLKYTKINVDEVMDFPFTVPKRFSVVN